jgi:hypothetical protein
MAHEIKPTPWFVFYEPPQLQKFVKQNHKPENPYKDLLKNLYPCRESNSVYDVENIFSYQ